MKSKNEDLGWTFIVFFWIVIMALIIGWVLNIIAIVHTNEMSGMLIGRIIGAILAPVGAVLGYF